MAGAAIVLSAFQGPTADQRDAGIRNVSRTFFLPAGDYQVSVLAGFSNKGNVQLQRRDKTGAFSDVVADFSKSSTEQFNASTGSYRVVSINANLSSAQIVSA